MLHTYWRVYSTTLAYGLKHKGETTHVHAGADSVGTSVESLWSDCPLSTYSGGAEEETVTLTTAAEEPRSRLSRVFHTVKKKKKVNVFNPETVDDFLLTHVSVLKVSHPNCGNYHTGAFVFDDNHVVSGVDIIVSVSHIYERFFTSMSLMDSWWFSTS